MAVVVLEQNHLPSGTAGYGFAAVLVMGFVTLGFRATRAALGASRSGVTSNPNGIILHNPTNDIAVSWDEIAGFHVGSDASGVAGPNPYTVGRVELHDGRSYYIAGTRRGGPVWRRSRRQEEVQRCVQQLNELLTQARARAVASSAR